MGAVEIIFGIVLLLFALAIIVVVLLQEGHQQSLGAITGGADTFLSKNKARSMDAFLARWTKFIAIGFFVLVLVINIIMYFKVSEYLRKCASLFDGSPFGMRGFCFYKSGFRREYHV